MVSEDRLAYNAGLALGLPTTKDWSTLNIRRMIYL
jgi:hypothetical protein